MHFEVTEKFKLNSHSVEKDIILHYLPDFFPPILLFAQHFDGSLRPVSLPLLVASSLSLPPVLGQPSHSLWGMPWRAAGFVWSLFVCRTEAVS